MPAVSRSLNIEECHTVPLWRYCDSGAIKMTYLSKAPTTFSIVKVVMLHQKQGLNIRQITSVFNNFLNIT